MEPYRIRIQDPAVLARMRTTFALCHAAVDIMRQNLRRRFPDADEEEIRRRLGEWRRQRPADEHAHLVKRSVERLGSGG